MEATFVRFSYDKESKDIIMEVVDFPKMYELLKDKEGTLEEWDTFHKEMSEGLTKFLTEYRSRELDGTPTDFELTGYPNHVIVDLPPEDSGQIDNDIFADSLIEYVYGMDDVEHQVHSPSAYEEGPKMISFLDFTHRRHITTAEGKTVDRLKFIFDWEVV